MEQWVRECFTWMDENLKFVVVMALLVITAIFTSPPIKRWEWLDFIPKRRGRTLRRARREFIDGLITDDFTNSIETRVYHGEMTREEAKDIYRRLKVLFPVRGLFPASDLLKEKIRKRLGTHTTPNFPDKKRTLKHVFDKPKRVVL